MRQTCIFSGTSHPGLVDKICNWLGDTPSKVALTKFKNGETSVEIRELASGIDQDCFVSNALQKHRCETKMSSSCNLAAPSTSLPLQPSPISSSSSSSSSSLPWYCLADRCSQDERLGHGTAHYDLCVQGRICQVCDGWVLH